MHVLHHRSSLLGRVLSRHHHQHELLWIVAANLSAARLLELFVCALNLGVFAQLLRHENLKATKALLVEMRLGILRTESLLGNDFRIAIVPAEILDDEEAALHHLDRSQPPAALLSIVRSREHFAFCADYKCCGLWQGIRRKSDLVEKELRLGLPAAKREVKFGWMKSIDSSA